MDKVKSAQLNVIISMVLYGTIGVIVRFIPLPSAVISMIRGLIGAPFLLLVLMIRKQKISWSAIKANFVRLFIYGAALGINWIFMFEAYRYTSVATATLCYYLAPIFIVAVSPFVLHERMTVKKLVCIVCALIGMVFVSGVAKNGLPSMAEARGVLFGLAAAVLYASIVIGNKKLHDISAYDRTIAQLALSALVLVPYNLLSGNFEGLGFSAASVILLVILGVVHTGFAYLLYFGSMEKLSSQTLAVLSYIDPVVAIILSAVVLHEALGLGDIVGAVLILGSAAVSEYTPNKRGGTT